MNKKHTYKTKNKTKKTNNTWLYFALMICLLGIGLVIWYSNSSFASFWSRAQTTSQLICPTPGGQSNLQLLPCGVITPTEGPTPFVPQQPPTVVRTPQTITVPNTPNDTCTPDGPMNGSCQCPPYQEPMGGGPGSGGQCNSKPIIYLYPTKKTMVDVRLEIPGSVTVSDPLYPKGGWNDVEAHPDGTLIYEGKKYRDLYYETATIKAKAPKEGIITDKANLEATLLKLTTDLGLNDFEQSEFMEYWMPELMALKSPYVFVSVFSHTEKERVDHVVISPEPDTRIEFLAYFKPVDVPYKVAPLKLTPAPRRDGFTMVEWGGTIDRD